jgi:hypothetical protein
MWLENPIDSHAHWYGFCLLGALGGRAMHKNQHDICTGSEQFYQEALQAPYIHPVRLHYRAEYAPN